MCSGVGKETTARCERYLGFMSKLGMVGGKVRLKRRYVDDFTASESR